MVDILMAAIECLFNQREPLRRQQIHGRFIGMLSVKCYFIEQLIHFGLTGVHRKIILPITRLYQFVRMIGVKRD